MKCENCKHWDSKGLYHAYDESDLKKGVCERIKPHFDCYEWGCGGDLKLKDSRKDDKAWTQDGSDYHAYLITLKDFGCVHFEAKSDD